MTLLIKKSIINQLVEIVGEEYVITSESEKLPYKYDASLFVGEVPHVVVQPRTVEETSQILALCNKYKIPVIPRGGGTSLTGGPVPLAGSVVLSMLRMDRILEVSIEDNYALVEAGVRLGQLNEYLKKNYNYFFPPDPASSVAATVGGVIANDSSGLTGVRYGSVKNWVLGLEVVLPNGNILRLGNKTLKYRVGYDLVSLFVGSEGTLGVITKAYLKIWPRPENILRFLIYLDEISKVGEVIVRLKKSRFALTSAEFIDKSYIDILKKIENLEAPEKGNYALIIDIECPKESVKRTVDNVLNILNPLNPVEIQYSDDPETIEELNRVRKGAGSVLLYMRKKSTETTITSDIIVPPSQLPSFLLALKNKIREYGMLAPMLGHIGEGNIHVDVFCDVSDKEDLSRAMKLLHEMGKMALEYGGSVSAEHGIGLEKRDLLVEEYKFRKSEEAVHIMGQIKKVLDPNNILNPTKVLKGL